MLNIGWSELLVVAVVAIAFVGPKDVLQLMRTFGLYAGKIRRAAYDFQREVEAAVAEGEAEDVARNLEAIKSNMGTAADFGLPADKPMMTGVPVGRPVTAPPPVEGGPAPAKTEPAELVESKRAEAKKTANEPATKKAAAKSAPPKAPPKTDPGA